MTSGEVLSPSSLAVKRFNFLTKRDSNRTSHPCGGTLQESVNSRSHFCCYAHMGYIISVYTVMNNIHLNYAFVPPILLPTCEAAPLTGAPDKPWSFPQVGSGLLPFVLPVLALPFP